MPSQPAGQPLGLHGHGLRERQHNGPLEPGGPPTAITLAVRRYRCCSCNGLATVVPCGVRRHRHYSAAAIAWAVALYGVAGCGPTTIRRRVSIFRIVGDSASSGWRTLCRWLDALAAGALFPSLPALRGTRRQIAERCSQVMSAAAPATARGRPLADQAFLGGVRMA